MLILMTHTRQSPRWYGALNYTWKPRKRKCITRNEGIRLSSTRPWYAEGVALSPHILYGNLAVSGKNVKLTSWGGRLTETNEKPGLPTQVIAVVCCIAREWERWELPSGARFTSVADWREKVYICLCLFLPLLFLFISFSLFLWLARSDQEDWQRCVIKHSRDKLDAADLTFRRVMVKLRHSIFCLPDIARFGI